MEGVEEEEVVVSEEDTGKEGDPKKTRSQLLGDLVRQGYRGAELTSALMVYEGNVLPPPSIPSVPAIPSLPTQSSSSTRQFVILDPELEPQFTNAQQTVYLQQQQHNYYQRPTMLSIPSFQSPALHWHLRIHRWPLRPLHALCTCPSHDHPLSLSLTTPNPPPALNRNPIRAPHLLRTQHSPILRPAAHQQSSRTPFKATRLHQMKN